MSGLPVRLPFFSRPKFRDTWASWAIPAHCASDNGLSAWPNSDVLVNHGDRLLATASDPIESKPAVVIGSKRTDSGVA